MQAGEVSLDQATQIAKAEAARPGSAREVFSGSSVKPHSSRPELVILVSHEVAKRGWTDVRDGELCKIPGVGPVDPKIVKEIAMDAFLNGVFFDGEDLRHFKRYTKHIPVEVLMALELGDRQRPRTISRE
jgi:hypothetical protein